MVMSRHGILTLTLVDRENSPSLTSAAFKRGASVEVKTDEKFLETGNVFFEYCCKKTSSWESVVGDYTTELWVHVLGPDGGHLVLDVAALKVAARRLRADGYTKPRRRGSPDSCVCAKLLIFNAYYRDAKSELAGSQVEAA